MSKFLHPARGLHQRLSSESVGSDESRQRVAEVPEKKEMDWSDMLLAIDGEKNQIEVTKEARRKSKEQSKAEGKRLREKLAKESKEGYRFLSQD